MARRTPRLEATHEKTLTPLKDRCEQCGQPLWVAYHRHRTGDHARLSCGD